MIILTPVDVSVYGVIQFEILNVHIKATQTSEPQMVGVIRCKDLLENQTDESDWYAFDGTGGNMVGTFPDRQAAAEALAA